MAKIVRILVLCIGIAAISCGNLFKEENKKELVRRLVNDYIEESGLLVVFWDGRDDDKDYVEPGKYIIVLETAEYSDQVTVEALKGGKVEANNEQHFEAGFWNSFQLEPPYPDPFRLYEGINVPIITPGKERIRVNIYKE